MSSSTHSAGDDTETGSNRRATVRDRALATLCDTSADGETVKATVLRELHHQHPAMALEDILELSVSIATPETDSMSESVDVVLDEALEQYGAWQAAKSGSGSTGAAIPATEDC